MSEHEAPIEDYLDRLLDRLRGDARSVRRVLGETEDHLYAATAARIAAGQPAEAAEREAVAQFGPVEAIAAGFNRQGPLLDRYRWFPTAGQLLDLAGIGLVAIGLSGLVERVMVSSWGKVFVVADPPGTRFPAASCRYWEHLHPQANGCVQAYLAESVSDGLWPRYLAGMLGVLVLAVLAFLRRRRGEGLLPALGTPLTLAAGVMSFGVAAVVLAGLAADRFGIAGGNGAGQWLSASAVAACFAAGFGLAGVRRLRTMRG
jgi:hypothetical protein